MTPITALIISIFMIMLFVILTVITIYIRKKEKTNTRHNPSLEQYQQEYLFENVSDKADYISDKNKTDVFDQITGLIKNKFHPISFKNDEDCEKLLISFLTGNLPNNVVTYGHTAKGDKLDIVIDGTYALELIVADNEEKLLYLMGLSLKSKKDFDKTAAIIVDVKKNPLF